MRPFIALLITVLLASTALADVAPSLKPDIHSLRLRRRHARVERAAGLGLAGVGLAGCAIAGVLLGVSGPANYDQGSRYWNGAWIALATGGALLLPGAALAIDGQYRLNEIDWRLRLLAGTFVLPSRSGLLAGIGLRF